MSRKELHAKIKAVIDEARMLWENAATQAAYEIQRAHCDNQMFTPGDAPTGCEHLTYQYGHSQSIAPCAEHYTDCPLYAEKKEGTDA